MTRTLSWTNWETRPRSRSTISDQSRHHLCEKKTASTARISSLLWPQLRRHLGLRENTAPAATASNHWPGNARGMFALAPGFVSGAVCTRARDENLDTAALRRRPHQPRSARRRSSWAIGSILSDGRAWLDTPCIHGACAARTLPPPGSRPARCRLCGGRPAGCQAGATRLAAHHVRVCWPAGARGCTGPASWVDRLAGLLAGHPAHTRRPASDCRTWAMRPSTRPPGWHPAS